MSDVYAHMTWITVFIMASKGYLCDLHPNIDDHDCHLVDYNYSDLGWVLLGVSCYFFIFREAIEVFGNDSFWTYLKDPWNWFENAAIGCVIASGLHFIHVIAEEQKPFHSLLITTVLFQFAFAVSFLRTTFLAYAQFVGGILNIFYELIPFFLVTGLILMAFAYAAFIQNFNKIDEENPGNFKDFLASFLTLFGEFLGGPERPTTPTDVLFGIMSVVILLNVVIAIISNAWDDSTGETTIRFWEYRLGFIEEVAYTKEVLSKPVHWFRYCIGMGQEAKRMSHQHVPAVLPPRPRRPKKSSSMRRLKHHMTRPEDDNKPTLSAWEKFAFWVSYLFYLLLGLISFGLAWPRRIRKDVFGRNNKRTVVLKKEDKKINSVKLDGIHKSVQQLNDANMEERMKKVEADVQRVQGTVDEVHDLLKNLAVQQLPAPQRR
eukprot:CAMPEP_0113605516 /NCGR_PEP_ID=MMETSP0017_2-20120614/2369_1 /TAXON_ID=2856 /ORGANISM="Cylindrotheca closterium" /LENGTH=431 /DNA_ID=CAMNT_0000514011 /DNA_START=32 /DNA_END=1327 /DNA_ORIENTATION=+ /assembly_acc=CAM_ASM_000147